MQSSGDSVAIDNDMDVTADLASHQSTTNLLPHTSLASKFPGFTANRSPRTSTTLENAPTDIVTGSAMDVWTGAESEIDLKNDDGAFEVMENRNESFVYNDETASSRDVNKGFTDARRGVSDSDMVQPDDPRMTHSRTLTAL